METICDPHVYIWYFNFGLGHPGSMHGINVSGRSSIVGSILDQIFDTKVDLYTINGHQRDWLCFLPDVISLQWSIFAKTSPSHINEEEGKYAK